MNKLTFYKVSFAAAVMATGIALVAAAGASSPETIARSGSAAWILGLLSIGSYMIGLVYPKEENGTVTRNSNDVRRSS